ncbi:hypothetical protein [Pantoea rwandensis]|uniref:hypothetical protein n=1 Tax=Pantoea rwandensis TaxID=1076550 RepID=UPI001FE409E4|nr:hypothetical protein [Pantoea rwandensis]
MKKTLIAAGMMLCASTVMAQETAFVYVSNGDSGTVTAYTLNKAKQTLSPIGEYQTGLKSMPMVVSKDKKNAVCLGTQSALSRIELAYRL